MEEYQEPIPQEEIKSEEPALLAPRPEPKPKPTCEICGKEFGRAVSLKSHIPWCKKNQKKLKRLERSEKAKAARSKRVPFGVPTKRLNAPKDPNHEYRVFNDNWRKEPGRIQRAKDAGYEIVDHEVTGITVGSNDDGSEIKGVLMRIPKELYDEDQEAKMRKIDEQEESLRRAEDVPHPYGVGVELKRN